MGVWSEWNENDNSTFIWCDACSSQIHLRSFLYSFECVCLRKRALLPSSVAWKFIIILTEWDENVQKRWLELKSVLIHYDWKYVIALQPTLCHVCPAVSSEKIKKNEMCRTIVFRREELMTYWKHVGSIFSSIGFFIDPISIKNAFHQIIDEEQQQHTHKGSTTKYFTDRILCYESRVQTFCMVLRGIPAIVLSLWKWISVWTWNRMAWWW